MKVSIRLILFLVVGITVVTFVIARNQVRVEKRGLRADLERRQRAAGRQMAASAARIGERMPRVAWIVIVLVALLTAFLLMVAGYDGYAGLSVAVGASAAINLL